MKRSNSVPSLLCLGLAVACGGPASLERFTPPEVDARSRGYLQQFVRGQIDSAVDRLVVPLRTRDVTAELRKIADILRNERFDTVRVIGAQTSVIGGVRHTNLTYELHSAFSWFLANVATVDTADTWFVEGVSAGTIAQPLELAAEFSLSGKSFLHYIWLVLTVACAAFSLGTAAFIATRRGMPRRWWWVALSLIGVGAFQLNWASGATNLALLNVQLASASFLRAGPAAPWILSFAIPVGAFLGVSQYHRWRPLSIRLALNR
jgi:hypothetical protein